MGANGDRATSRRSKRRADKLLTPAEAGEMLRNARAQLGIELLEVHDRTGISWRNLEALETGEVQRFSDPAAAAVAMRRYAELVSLEPEPLVKSVTSPVLALAGAPSGGANAGSWAPGPTTPDASGHLRRYYGDQSHLGSFTQTAQVPAVGGWTSGQANGAAQPGGPPNGHRAPRRRPKAPWALRFMMWFVLFLLLVGVAGISINHYKPQWLRDIHVLASSPKPTVPSSPGTHNQSPPTSNDHDDEAVRFPRHNVAYRYRDSEREGRGSRLHRRHRHLQPLLGRRVGPRKHQLSRQPDTHSRTDGQHPDHRGPGEREARSTRRRYIGEDRREYGLRVDASPERSPVRRNLHPHLTRQLTGPVDWPS